MHPEVAQILEKYREDEQNIDNLCKKFDEKIGKLERRNDISKVCHFPTESEAKERNKTLLKNLETVKGNLRSKAIFSPTEMQWENICKNYQLEPSLPVTTWRCNTSIYV